MSSRLAVASAVLLLATCALSGCGQKGPLTLPPKPGMATPAAAHHHRKHLPATPAATLPATAPGAAASTSAPAPATTTGT